MQNHDNEKTVILTNTSGVETGTRLNGVYQIDKKIGMGGMSEIYKGHNIQTMDEVAIKVILPEFTKDEKIISLFKHEALTLNRLNHEAIIRYHVFSHDPSADLLYLAMEYVNGPTLRDSLKQKSLSQTDACILISKVAEGLDSAHQEGIVHRDISTDNIILTNGNIQTPKVIDFGIALSSEANDSTLIESGFAGKYSFVSPEQLGLFGGKMKPTSDIYSLGLVFAATLLGKPLNMSGTHAEVVMKRQSLPDISAINPGVKSIIEKMLQPNPAHRIQSMREVVESLEPFCQSSKGQKSQEHKTVRNQYAYNSHNAKVEKKSMSWLTVILATALLGIGVYYGFTQTRTGQNLVQIALSNLTQQTPKPDEKPDPTPITKSGKSEFKVSSDERTNEKVKDKIIVPEPASKPEPNKEQEVIREKLPKPQKSTEQKTQQEVASLSPTKPVQPSITRSPITPSQWISSFNGGDCFYAQSLFANATSIKVEGFGQNIASFQDMDTRFRSAYKFEPDIGVRLVTKPQCAALDYISSQKLDSNPLKFSVKRDLIKNGEPLEAVLSGITQKNIYLFIMPPDGTMINVTSITQRYSDEVIIQIPYDSFASTKVKDGYLILAFASNSTINKFQQPRIKNAVEFLSQIKADHNDVVSSMKYIKKQ